MSGMKDCLGDSLYYGTSPYKLHRANDPSTSVAAAYGVGTTKLEKEVHKAIQSFGPDGCISDQVRALFPGKSYSSITARYKALADKGLISCGPDTRPGKSGRPQRVMRSLVAA